MAAFNSGTLARDLSILQEDKIYRIDVSIHLGVSREVILDGEDLAIPEVVEQHLQNPQEGRIKPMRQQVFPELKTAEATLIELRRRFYFDCCVEIDAKRFVGASRFSEAIGRYEALESESRRQLEMLEELHHVALERWIDNDVTPRLIAAGYEGMDLRVKLNKYRLRFPSLTRLQKRFGVSLDYQPHRSLTDLLENDVAAKKLRLEQAELEVAIAHTEIEQQRHQEEAAAIRRASRYQEERLKRAVDDKMDELRHQLLDIAKRNLEKVRNAGWHTGTLPKGMRQELESLTQSARILMEQDQSLETISEGLFQVHTTGTSTNANQDSDLLQEQVQSLLNELDNQFVQQVQEIEEMHEAITDAEDDRSFWVNWGTA